MNRHMGPIDLAKYARPQEIIRDTRLDRIKIVRTDISFVAALLQMDGLKAVKMAGWPEGGIIVGAQVVTPVNMEGQVVPQLVITLMNPDWPIHLEGTPVTECSISYAARVVEPLEEESSG